MFQQTFPFWVTCLGRGLTTNYKIWKYSVYSWNLPTLPSLISQKGGGNKVMLGLFIFKYLLQPTFGESILMDLVPRHFFSEQTQVYVDRHQIKLVLTPTAHNFNSMNTEALPFFLLKNPNWLLLEILAGMKAHSSHCISNFCSALLAVCFSNSQKALIWEWLQARERTESEFKFILENAKITSGGKWSSAGRSRTKVVHGRQKQPSA